jgi:hypothetical protein
LPVLYRLRGYTRSLRALPEGRCQKLQIPTAIFLSVDFSEALPAQKATQEISKTEAIS